MEIPQRKFSTVVPGTDIKNVVKGKLSLMTVTTENLPSQFEDGDTAMNMYKKTSSNAVINRTDSTDKENGGVRVVIRKINKGRDTSNARSTHQTGASLEKSETNSTHRPSNKTSAVKLEPTPGYSPSFPKENTDRNILQIPKNHIKLFNNPKLESDEYLMNEKEEVKIDVKQTNDLASLNLVAKAESCLSPDIASRQRRYVKPVPQYDMTSDPGIKQSPFSIQPNHDTSREIGH